jgi:hypothetical protein
MWSDWQLEAMRPITDRPEHCNRQSEFTHTIATTSISSCKSGDANSETPMPVDAG